jgi:dihydroorotase
VLHPLLSRTPSLRCVLEHVSTCEAVAFVRDGALRGRLGATVTPQHMTLSRNDMLVGGLRPHLYCLPILKRERHRAAVAEAATSGDERFFLGTDSAPHPEAAKEASCGCAGCFSAHAAMPLYAAAFEAAGALHRLEGFASLHGAAFYRRPPSEQRITLRRRRWRVPPSYDFGDSRVVPLGAGEELEWDCELVS